MTIRLNVVNSKGNLIETWLTDMANPGSMLVYPVRYDLYGGQIRVIRERDELWDNRADPDLKGDDDFQI